MNLCRLLLQCGIEACFYNENEDIRTMGASLSNEIAINAEHVAFSDQISMQGAVRYAREFCTLLFFLFVKMIPVAMSISSVRPVCVLKWMNVRIILNFVCLQLYTHFLHLCNLIASLC